jgi:lysophospholipase L1-like esterase
MKTQFKQKFLPLSRSPLLLGALLLLGGMARAQQAPPFQEEIRAFRSADSINFPAAGSILFVGSSSFRFWKDVQEYFPGRRILNRGFGGSTLLDLIRYTDDIVIPYHPAQIVVYSGENDLAYDSSLSAGEVAARFEQWFRLVRARLGILPLVYVSIKPSPSREAIRPRVVRANRLIRDFLAKQPKARYADVYSPMLLPDGSPRPDLFIEDRLHMNARGYAIWKKVLDPLLIPAASPRPVK